jgi:hypothetical protein
MISVTDGEDTARQVENCLDKFSLENYFRLNIKLQDCPDLDDIDCMQKLQRSVHFQSEVEFNRQKIVSTILISFFYFELTRKPRWENGFYYCKGFIRCRNNATAVVDAIKSDFLAETVFMTENEVLASFNGRADICADCYCYCKHVAFYIRHPTDCITISLKIDQYFSRRIRGFLQTV